MSSCAASCCTCCPKASSASATSASLPTAAAPLSCRFAFNYSTQYRHRNPNQKHRLPRNRILFGAVPNVAAPWWSSKDLLRPSSNFVLHPGSPEPRHETPIPISLARCLPAPTGLVRFRCPSTKLLASSFRSQTTIEPIRPALRLAPSPIPRVFLITATPLNLHRRFLTGGFLQTAVSDAPRTPPEIYLPLHMGRVRYSTSVSRQFPEQPRNPPGVPFVPSRNQFVHKNSS